MFRLGGTLFRLAGTLGGTMEDRKYVRGLASVLPDDENQPPIQAYFNPPKEKHYNAKWLLLWQDETGMSMQEQAKMERPLTQTEYRVRDWIIGEIGFGNYVYLNQAEIGRQLRITRSHISEAIKRLLELEILLGGPKNGRSNTYMVNPAFCFSGSLNKGIKAKKEYMEIKRAKVLQFDDNDSEVK